MILIDKLLSNILNKDKKAELINLIVDNIHKVDLFYIEESIILPKYKDLKTPESVSGFLEDLRNPRKISNGMIIDFMDLDRRRNFALDSLNYANKRGKFCNPKPLFDYYVTFDMLDEDQLKWYFYFRQRALSGEYLETEISYIILFSYELINYTFNDSAAFNISMLIRLYENYLEKQPRLINYLPGWIFDLLWEVDEKELALEWGSSLIVYKEPIFNKINEQKDELERIPFTLWKHYIQKLRRTEFLKGNRNKIYNVFKQSISLLNDTYKMQNTNLIEKWFNVTETKHFRNLFASAYIAREAGKIQMSIQAVEANKCLYAEVTALFRMSENVIRDLEKDKRRLKVEDVLPENFENILIDRIQSQKNNKIRDRFKLVQTTISTDSHVNIPKPQLEKKVEKLIEFNKSKIEILSKQSEELQRTFRDKGYEDEDCDAEIQENTPMIIQESEIATSLINSSLNIFDKLNDVNVASSSGEEGFNNSLTNREKEYILSFQDFKRDIYESKIYFKQNGIMAGTFISKINEKANKYLEDNLIELNKDYYEINDEFEDIISNMKVGN